MYIANSRTTTIKIVKKNDMLRKDGIWNHEKFSIKTLTGKKSRKQK